MAKIYFTISTAIYLASVHIFLSLSSTGFLWVLSSKLRIRARGLSLGLRRMRGNRIGQTTKIYGLICIFYFFRSVSFIIVEYKIHPGPSVCLRNGNHFVYILSLLLTAKKEGVAKIRISHPSFLQNSPRTNNCTRF